MTEIRPLTRRIVGVYFLALALRVATYSAIYLLVSLIFPDSPEFKPYSLLCVMLAVSSVDAAGALRTNPSAETRTFANVGAVALTALWLYVALNDLLGPSQTSETLLTGGVLIAFSLVSLWRRTRRSRAG